MHFSKMSSSMEIRLSTVSGLESNHVWVKKIVEEI